MPAPQKGRIFISYRRADSAGYAGRIYDRLTAHFGKDAVFMDVDTIEAGLDFVEVLENAVQSCDVLVTLIGRQWLSIKDEEGKRRLDNPQDFVRIEVAAALSRSIRVIPVLVDGVPMPHSDQLPGNLKLLARRNAVFVNHYSFHNDANRLIEQLELALKAAEESKFLKSKELKEREVQKKRQVEIENLLSQADIALDLQDWELAKEKLEAIAMLEPEHVQAQVKLAIVDRKLQEKIEQTLAEEKARQDATKIPNKGEKGRERIKQEEKANKEIVKRESAKKAELDAVKKTVREKVNRESAENAAEDKIAQEQVLQNKLKQISTYVLPSKLKARSWVVYSAIAFIAIIICISGGVWLSNIMFPASPTKPAAIEPNTEEPDIIEPTKEEPAADEFATEKPATEQGSIRIGVRGDIVWPFNMYDGSSPSGFEIDLAEEIVRRLYSEPISIEWVPLTASDRFIALQNGEIDLLIQTTAHTISREEFGLWTSNYFLDGARLLVHIDSGIKNINDLDGRAIAVTAGTPTELILTDAASAAGIGYTPIVFDTSIDAYNGFLEGRADAFISDWSYLLTLSKDDSNYRVIGELLSSEPFGIAIPLDKSEFRDEVNSVLLDIIADGTWQKIYDRWFTDPPPWTLNEMLAEPPVNR